VRVCAYCTHVAARVPLLGHSIRRVLSATHHSKPPPSLPPSLPPSFPPSFSPQVRDECVVMQGEEACEAVIEAHKACLRSEGFKI